MNRCLSPTCLDGPPLDADDTEPRPRIVDEPYTLCTKHGNALERHLGDLPALSEELRRILLHGRPAAGRLGNSPTKGSPPLPSRGFDTTHDLLTDLQATLVSWVRMVAEERNLTLPANSSTSRLASWLLVQHDWLTQHGAAGDYADEVATLHRQAEGIARTRSGWHRSVAPCPECGAHDLHRQDGEDAHLCDGCGRTVQHDEHERHKAAQAAFWTVTADEAANLAGVPGGTFRRWVSEGRVERIAGVEPARYWREQVVAMTREDVA